MLISSWYVKYFIVAYVALKSGLGINLTYPFLNWVNSSKFSSAKGSEQWMAVRLKGQAKVGYPTNQTASNYRDIHCYLRAWTLNLVLVVHDANNYTHY